MELARLTEQFNSARGLVEEIESREKLASSEKKECAKDITARADALAAERKKVMYDRQEEAKEAQANEAKFQTAMVNAVTLLTQQLVASEAREAQTAAQFVKLVDHLISKDK